MSGRRCETEGWASRRREAHRVCVSDRRIVRGHLGRCKAKREHAHMLYDAAMALQAITRGFVDRLYVRCRTVRGARCDFVL